MDQDKLRYYWKSFVSLLDFVDLIKDQSTLRAKLKTKILDLAHEVQEELKQTCCNGQVCDKCKDCKCENKGGKS